jgi:uncharacterized protein (DUF1800 family)
VLADLARHPATARHLADKLVRHFVSDQPLPALAGKLERCFLDTDGDLKELARTLVEAPETWNAPRNKLRRPIEWLVVVSRMTGQLMPSARHVIYFGGLLGEPIWQPFLPKGFPDDNDAWLEGVPRRLDIANGHAARVARNLDVKALAAETFGPLLSSETQFAIARAANRSQALALLLMSPEIQRR